MIGNSFSYTGNFVFFGLAPSTEYEVIIQSRNREGWSDATDIFRFNTRSQGISTTIVSKYNAGLINSCNKKHSYFLLISISDFNPLEQPYQHQGYFSGSETSSLSSAITAMCATLLLVNF